MAIWKIKNAATRPFKADGVTLNPLWAYLMEARAFSAARFRFRKNRVMVRVDDDMHTLGEVEAIYDQAITDFGANAFDARWPSWMRVNLARANNEVPAYLPVEDIVVTPGDPLADPPVPDVTRRPKYNELHLYSEKGGFGWAPCSDGNRYFWMSITKQLDAETGIRVVRPNAVPDE